MRIGIVHMHRTRHPAADYHVAGTTGDGTTAGHGHTTLLISHIQRSISTGSVYSVQFSLRSAAPHSAI